MALRTGSSPSALCAEDGRGELGMSYYLTLKAALPALLEEGDTDGAERTPAPVVVNQSFVRRFFPQGEPLGRQFGTGRDQIAKASFEIVGVVSDSRYRSFREPFQPTLFSCFCGTRSGDSTFHNYSGL